MKIKANELRVLERVYLCTDCCNQVFDWAKLHHSQRDIAGGLVQRRLLRRIDHCVEVDGDGFQLDPERGGAGYQLTRRGYESLTSHDAQKYPTSLRRFELPIHKRRGKK